MFTNTNTEKNYKPAKYYKEISCIVCNASGKVPPIQHIQGPQLNNERLALAIMMAMTGICLACHGRGSHTVLDREEV